MIGSNNYKIVKFRDTDFEMDVRVSIEEKTVWLSQSEIANLYGKPRQTIHKYAQNLIAAVDKNNRIVNDLSTNYQVRKVGKTNLYNLEFILLVGDKIESNRGLLLKEFLNKYFDDSSKENDDTIIYNNGNLNLTVNVSPKEETVWLNVNQIAALFETTIQNIYMHIKNIQYEGEINNSLCKESLNTDVNLSTVTQESLNTDVNLSTVTQESLNTEKHESFHKQIPSFGADGKTYLLDFYNLDMILAVGYRVKSKKAIEFRKWANKVLKQYLLKGYAINEDRVTVSKENFLQLENDIQGIKKEIENIKIKTFIEPLKEKILFEGQYFDARELLCSLCAKAKENLIVIDPYFDIVGLTIVKKLENVDVTIVLSSKAKLNKYDTITFKKQYYWIKILYKSNFHDRFLIIDKKECYALGTSLNYMGSRISAINKIEDIDIINTLVGKLEKNTH